MIQSDTPIFLIHGLGSVFGTLTIIQWTLVRHGYTSVTQISYPASTLTLEESVAYVAHEIKQCLTAPDVPIVVVGQSLGGLVCNRLHKTGLNVIAGFYFVAPLRGSALLRWCRGALPAPLFNLFNLKIFDDLCAITREAEPPHRYATLGVAWLWPLSTFDGRVRADETFLDIKHHTHLTCSDHMCVVLDPRLHDALVQFLKSGAE